MLQTRPGGLAQEPSGCGLELVVTRPGGLAQEPSGCGWKMVTRPGGLAQEPSDCGLELVEEVTRPGGLAQEPSDCGLVLVCHSVSLYFLFKLFPLGQEEPKGGRSSKLPTNLCVKSILDRLSLFGFWIFVMNELLSSCSWCFKTSPLVVCT